MKELGEIERILRDAGLESERVRRIIDAVCWEMMQQLSSSDKAHVLRDKIMESISQ